MAVNERLTRAKTRLDAYYNAEIAILSGQEYRIGTRSLTRADLGEVREAIKELEALITELEYQAQKGGGKRRAYRITLRDL